jgi:2-dehydropantoate 2-reductase
MRIAIAGTGGLGGYYGAMLARAGHEVACIARGAHLRAIQEQGLTLRSEEAGEFTVAVAASDDPREIGPVDLVLFGVKSYDTEALAARLPPLMGPGTMVLSLQNGVDNEERIARIVGEGAVLGGVVYRTAHVAAPGVIVEGGLAGRIRFGELTGGISPRAERLLATFHAAGLAAELCPDIRIVLWEKFLSIIAGGSLSGLTRLPYRALCSYPDTFALCRGMMEEAVAVARALGVRLPDDAIERQLAVLAEASPSVRSSLSRDLAAGRRIEIEALNGAIVRLGREHGVPTPLNFAVYAALKPHADGVSAGAEAYPEGGPVAMP